MYLPLVDPDDMSSSLRATYEVASPAGKRFVGVMAHAPEHAERLFAYYNNVRYQTRLGIKLSELARIAASNDTHCEV
jgi:hypothetical protein